MLLFYIHNCSITSLKSWIISKHPHTQRHLNVPEITVITDATQQIRGVLRGNDIDPEACVSIPLSHTADFRSSSMVSAGLLFLSIITSKFNRYWQLFVSDGKLIRGHGGPACLCTLHFSSFSDKKQTQWLGVRRRTKHTDPSLFIVMTAWDNNKRLVCFASYLMQQAIDVAETHQ